MNGITEHADIEEQMKIADKDDTPFNIGNAFGSQRASNFPSEFL